MGSPLTGTFSGLTNGNWYVNVYSPTEISGTMNGSFSGTAVTEDISVPAMGSMPGISIPVSGLIDGTFTLKTDGSLAFTGQVSYKLGVQGTSVNAVTGFDFNIPADMSQGIKMSGSIPFSGSQDVNVPLAGSITVDYTIASDFDIALKPGDPSAFAPVKTQDNPSDVWYITGVLPDQSTCGASSSLTSTPLNFNNAPINITAHGSTLTGSSSNPADESVVHGNAVISQPGYFSIAVDQSVSSVSVFIFCDTDNSGGGSPGDIGGHYCDAATGSPGIVYSPGTGNTIDIAGFEMGSMPVNIAGNVIIDGATLDGIGKDVKIVAQVYDSSGTVLDYSYSSVNSLDFDVWVNNVSTGDAVSLEVFVDTNGNGQKDSGEPAGDVSHTVGPNAADNDSILVTLS